MIRKTPASSFFLIVLFFAFGVFFVSNGSFAGEDWKNEFETVCSKTGETQGMSVEGLAALIERCDRLLPLIEALPETPRKIYLKRLKACRDLFVFMLEEKKNLD